MTRVNTAESINQELEKQLHRRLGPIFSRYGLDLKELLTPLKWKPLVLVIGNYSSGKSTFINELLGKEVQRTGQAPTDDSFTILTTTEDGEDEGEEPGATVVNNEHLPFTLLKHFGECLFSHLRLKRVKSETLTDIAIIDTPGMLDSVTEKDRGYDYLRVVGELARLADLIILMFDPHKAGTIKETYQAIRSTLPGATGEDRVLYVLNRIDECSNIADLLKSYGTLCWNLSQMTGRKDVPRIYLTFAQGKREVIDDFETWNKERQELRQAVLSAPKMRKNHILEEVDRIARELSLLIEALDAFSTGFMQKLKQASRFALLCAFLLGGGGDLLSHLFLGFPETPFLAALFSGSLSTAQGVGPAIGVLLTLALFSMYLRRFLLPGFVKTSLERLDELIPLETTYKKDLWHRVQKMARKLIAERPVTMLFRLHGSNRQRVEKFLDKELKHLFE